EGGEPVGAREGDNTIDVEPQQAVGGTRSSPARARGCPEVGKGARRDHLEQLTGALVEGELLTTWVSRLAEVGVASDDGDRMLTHLITVGGECAYDGYRPHAGGR